MDLKEFYFSIRSSKETTDINRVTEAAHSYDGKPVWTEGENGQLFYVSETTLYYLQQFLNYTPQKNNTSFNIASFLLVEHWCFSRGLYEIGLLLLTARSFILAILVATTKSASLGLFLLVIFLEIGIRWAFGKYANSLYIGKVEERYDRNLRTVPHIWYGVISFCLIPVFLELVLLTAR